MFSQIFKFFDRLEDKVRGRLVRHPLLYGLVAGTATILFWRGIWETATLFDLHPITSLILGLIGLLVTGIFVSSFIGTRLLISGMTGEKKLEEKELSEIISEEDKLEKIYKKLDRIEGEIEKMEEKK